MSANPRVADYAIHPQFTHRWSPRAFTGEAIPEETLLSFFEAARWAPSAYNSQPWRFLYARRDTPNWERYLGLLNEFNRSWAQQASALVLVMSKTTFAAPGSSEEKPALWHSFDTGSAWGFLALQASLAGWHTHGMAGFDQALTRKELKIPEGYAGISYGRSVAGHPYTAFFRANLNALVSTGKARILARPNVVTMNSRALLQLDDEEIEVALVYPEDADSNSGKHSVYSDIGAAILGYQEGDAIDWRISDRTRRIEIRKVLYQPEAAGHFHL